MPRAGVLAIVCAWLLASCAAAPEPRAAGFPQVPPAAAGATWDSARLGEAIAYVAQKNSTAFLIVQKGAVVAEHRWPAPSGAFRERFTHGLTAQGDLLEDVASMQKSVVAILAEIAIDKGLLDVSKPMTDYLGAGWSRATPDQERAIRVIHVMQMNTGLDERFAFEAPAGARFFYNTPVYASLKPLLEKVSGLTLDGLTRDWLTGPLGMNDTSWRQRPGELASSSANATGLVTTARDMARIGALVLARGKAPDGRQVVSEQRLAEMFTNSPTNPAYGRLWWLNDGDWAVGAGPAARRSDGPLIPSAPRALFAAQGAMDRKLYIAPALDLVVVRMGADTGDPRFNDLLWHKLSAALPHS
jgi:CubicO group peptidase (beta-lactamase class C family)